MSLISLIRKGVEEAAENLPPDTLARLLGVEERRVVDQFGNERELDLTNLERVPDVAQSPLMRYDPPRGQPKTLDPYLTKKNANRLADVALRGEAKGGREWYNTEPLRERFIEELGAEDGVRSFERYMDIVAATSPRSKVDMNNRRASYLYTRDKQGQPIANLTNKDFPPGYGHLAHETQNYLLRDLGDGGHFSSIDRPKTSSFAENLKGNQQPMTIDTHNMAAVTNNPKNKVSPSKTQYRYLEEFEGEIADRLNMTPAQFQASVWMGGGTGVADDRPFLEVFDDVVARTAERNKVSKKQALSDFIQGKTPLYGLAGLSTGMLVAPEDAEAGAPSLLLRQLRERLSRGPVEVGGRSLPGAPNTPNIPGGGPMRVGQNPDAVRAAEEYARRTGIDYTPLENYVQVDPERGSRIARAYERMPHNPDDPRTAAAYKALADETMDQYDNMLSAGIEPYFIRGADPYAESPYLSLLDLAQNKRLGVFPTDEGFGTDEAFDVTGNPLLAMSQLKLGGEPARVNDIFRAVHDFYGHAKPGVGFRAKGEENAYQSHAGMYSPQARPAAATETRGQNSWLNFGPHGETNRTAGIDDTVFADQKTGLMPNWAVNEGLETVPRPPVSPELARAVDDRGMLELTHYSRGPVDIVDPERYGSGLSGRTIAERNRAYDPDFVKRSYYGIEGDVDRPYRRESGLGNTANVAEVAADLLYDPRQDPSGIWRKAGGSTAGEKAVRDAGFSGYWADDPKLGKVAVVFDPLEVKRLREAGFADPIMLGGAAAAGAGAAGAAAEPSLLQTADRYAGYALDALEMPQRGLLALGDLGGGLLTGQGFDESLRRAAETAERPVGDTAYEIGGAVTDRTGSPAAGLLAYLTALAGPSPF